MANKYDELFEKWSKKLPNNLEWDWSEKQYGSSNGVVYKFGTKNTHVEYAGGIKLPIVLKQATHSIIAHMSIISTPFPNCCGMYILHGFLCSSRFDAEDYWDFIQLVVSRDINPSIAIITHAHGADDTVPNKTIKSNGQLLKTTHNGNYGTTISTYMIYPDKHKEYLSTNTDKILKPIQRELA